MNPQVTFMRQNTLAIPPILAPFCQLLTCFAKMPHPTAKPDSMVAGANNLA
jgi:hypothetical protein